MKLITFKFLEAEFDYGIWHYDLAVDSKAFKKLDQKHKDVIYAEFNILINHVEESIEALEFKLFNPYY